MITQAKASLKATLLAYVPTELARLVTVTGLTDFSNAANGGTLDAPEAGDIHIHRVDEDLLFNAKASIVFFDFSEETIEDERYQGQTIAPFDSRYTFILHCYATDTDYKRAQERAELLAHATRIAARRYGTYTAGAITPDSGRLADVTSGMMSPVGQGQNDTTMMAGIGIEIFARARNNTTVTAYA